MSDIVVDFILTVIGVSLILTGIIILSHYYVKPSAKETYCVTHGGRYVSRDLCIKRDALIE
jgi:hypothetical protein